MSGGGTVGGKHGSIYLRMQKVDMIREYFIYSFHECANFSNVIEINKYKTYKKTNVLCENHEIQAFDDAWHGQVPGAK